MMPSTQPSVNRPSDRRHAARARRSIGRRRGFTLTELLVVIGIIVLVLGIAVPMGARAWKQGDRTRTAADLQAISAALEAYRQDHRAYPEVPTGALWGGGPTEFKGARTLCRWLIGPGPERSTAPADVADGVGEGTTGPASSRGAPGFRARRSPGPDGVFGNLDDLFQGPVYGPYLSPDRFKLGDPTSTGTSAGYGYLCILDRYNKPILYYPATGKPNIRLANGYIADRSASAKPMYNALDNVGTQSVAGMPRETLCRMMGDFNANGMIEPAAAAGEAPAFEGPFLLWSAGPDEIFGPPPMMPVGSVPEVRRAVEKSDDITNFRN